QGTFVGVVHVRLRRPAHRTGGAGGPVRGARARETAESAAPVRAAPREGGEPASGRTAMTRCSPRSYTFVFGSALGALVVLAGAASAAPPPKTASADAFLARHPGDWRVSFDPVTAHPTFVYGDRVPLGPP